MSIYNYLELQPVEPTDDGTVSDLDTFEHDDVIDLQEDIDEQELEQKWDEISHTFNDADDKITFSKE